MGGNVYSISGVAGGCETGGILEFGGGIYGRDLYMHVHISLLYGEYVG